MSPLFCTLAFYLLYPNICRLAEICPVAGSPPAFCTDKFASRTRRLIRSRSPLLPTLHMCFLPALFVCHKHLHDLLSESNYRTFRTPAKSYSNTTCFLIFSNRLPLTPSASAADSSCAPKLKKSSSPVSGPMPCTPAAAHGQQN